MWSFHDLEWPLAPGLLWKDALEEMEVVDREKGPTSRTQKSSGRPWRPFTQVHTLPSSDREQVHAQGRGCGKGISMPKMPAFYAVSYLQGGDHSKCFLIYFPSSNN